MKIARLTAAAALTACSALTFATPPAAQAAAAAYPSGCGTHLSGVNDMKSLTHSYTVRIYPKACEKSYFTGSTTYYYLTYTDVPAVTIYGSTVLSDSDASTPIHAKTYKDANGRTTGTRWDFTVKLKTSGGSDSILYYVYVYPAGTDIVRTNGDGSKTDDGLDSWD